MSKYNILLIEEDKEKLSRLKNSLSDPSLYNYVSATTYSEAKKILRRRGKDFSTVIIDLDVQEESFGSTGIKAYQQAFGNSGKGTKIILISAKGLEYTKTVLSLSPKVRYLPIGETPDLSVLLSEIHLQRESSAHNIKNPLKRIRHQIYNAHQYDQAIIEARELHVSSKDSKRKRRLLCAAVAYAVNDSLEEISEDAFGEFSSRGKALHLRKAIPGARLLTSASAHAVVLYEDELDEKNKEKFVLKVCIEDFFKFHLPQHYENLKQIREVNQRRKEQVAKEKQYINYAKAIWHEKEPKINALAIDYVEGETLYFRQLKGRLEEEEVNGTLEQIARLMMEGTNFKKVDGSLPSQPNLSEYLSTKTSHALYVFEKALGIKFSEDEKKFFGSTTQKLVSGWRKFTPALFYLDGSPRNFIHTPRIDKQTHVDVEECYLVPPTFVLSPFLDGLFIRGKISEGRAFDRENYMKVFLEHLKKAGQIAKTSPGLVPSFEELKHEYFALASPIRNITWSARKLKFAAKANRDRNIKEREDNISESLEHLALAADAIQEHKTELAEIVGQTELENYLGMLQVIRAIGLSKRPAQDKGDASKLQSP